MLLKKSFYFAISMLIILGCSEVFAQSCSFKTQIKYPDGSVECIENSNLANVIPLGEKTTLIELIKGTKDYAIAKSKDLKCNALGFGSAMTNSASISANLAKQQALDSCSKGGCDCELVVQSGTSIFSRDKLLTNIQSSNMTQASAGSSESQTESISSNKNAGSCNFKTQIKYQDGAIECIDNSLLAYQVPLGEKLPLIELINKTRVYAIAQSNDAQCKGIFIGTYNGPITSAFQAQIYTQTEKYALDKCSERGCNCAITIRDGIAMTSKNSIIANLSFPGGEQKFTNQFASISGKNLPEQENSEKELQLRKIQQSELQKQQKEKEQKLAEEKRIQAELIAKAQAEREQKLAEERRQQAELAEKARVEKEQKEAEQKARAQLAAEAKLRSQAIGKRLALVIGNAKYQQRPLDNSVNDANDMSRALKASGFEVIDVRDANLSQMRAAVRNFGDRLLNNDVGLVYYSGHGVEVKGKNYFIPVNADIKRSDEIADQSLDVGLVLDKMETAQKPVNILIVDACRDDPFGRGFRSGSRGLATMDAPQGTIIAFATSPGKVAADGDGRNSPYTKNLVQAMQEPNVPIEQVFKKVRRAVQLETKNQQTPWENTSLSGDFYFKVQ